MGEVLGEETTEKIVNTLNEIKEEGAVGTLEKKELKLFEKGNMLKPFEFCLEHYKILLSVFLLITVLSVSPLLFSTPTREAFAGWVKNSVGDSWIFSIFGEENISDGGNLTNDSNDSEIDGGDDIGTSVITDNIVSNVTNVTNDSTPASKSSGGGGGGGGCTNDAGCSAAGSFCDAKTPYLCSPGSDGCYDRTNRDTCSMGCGNAVCILIGEIDSCQQLDQENGTYLLSSAIENNSLTGACMEITADNVTLDCQNYSNYILSDDAVAGIYSNGSDTVIKNCNISMSLSSGGHGITLENASGAHVFNNTLNSQYAGIFLNNASGNLIENNTISENNDKGVHISLGSDNVIRNNNISNGNNFGVLISAGSNNTFENNEIVSNVITGIGIEQYSSVLTTLNWLINNMVIFSERNINLHNSSDNTLVNNTISNSTWDEGLRIYEGSGNLIENNTIEYNQLSGIHFQSSSNNTIWNNTVRSNGLDSEYGINFAGTSLFNVITWNIIESNANGNVSGVSQLIFENNTCGDWATCGGG